MERKMEMEVVEIEETTVALLLIFFNKNNYFIM